MVVVVTDFEVLPKLQLIYELHDEVVRFSHDIFAEILFNRAREMDEDDVRMLILKSLFRDTKVLMEMSRVSDVTMAADDDDLRETCKWVRLMRTTIRSAVNDGYEAMLSQ